MGNLFGCQEVNLGKLPDVTFLTRTEVQKDSWLK